MARRHQAVSAVVDTAEKASGSPDCNPDAERNGEQVAGSLENADLSLDPLDGNPPADQSTNNGLSVQQEKWIVPTRYEFGGMLQPAKYFAAECGADNGCRKNGASIGIGKRIAVASPQSQIKETTDEVG